MVLQCGTVRAFVLHLLVCEEQTITERKMLINCRVLKAGLDRNIMKGGSSNECSKAYLPILMVP